MPPCFAAPLVVGLVISAGVVGAIMSAGALAFATLLLPLLFLSGFIMVFLFSLTLGGLGASLLLGKLVSLATTAALGLGLGWAAIKLGPPVLSRALPAAWRMRGSDSVSEEEEEPRASTRKAGRSRGQAAARGGKGSRAGDEDDDDNESGELPAAAELREFDQLLAERAKERSRKGPL